jgi:plasmid replication initiation protein
MDHFKTRVLDLAISEISEKTDIEATYQQHKKGRSISGFLFLLNKKI